MDIFVAGSPLELPDDMSFEFSRENPLLTSAGGYSYSIDVPLFGSRNEEIFGSLWRPDVDIFSVRFPAQIVAGPVVLTGVVMIVDVSQSTVSLQFLEGKSQQNSERSFEELFVNELSLGSSSLPVARRLISVDDARRPYGWPVGDAVADAVALPWVIRDSGELIHNAVALENNTLVWKPQWVQSKRGGETGWANRVPVQENLSYMPYLLTVALRVAAAVGYEADFSAWEDDAQKRQLVVCNALPASLLLRDFSWLLPHWSVQEFFDNIGTVLEGEFEIDHVAKSIVFRFTADIQAEIGASPVVVDEVLDEFSVEVDIDDDEFKAATELTKNVGYADNSSRFWNLKACDWFVRRSLAETAHADDGATRGDNENYHRPRPQGWIYTPEYLSNSERFRKFGSFAEMRAELRPYKYAATYRGYPYDALFYCSDLRCYFILRSEDLVTVDDDFVAHHPGDREEFSLVDGQSYYLYNLCAVDEFGDFIVRDDDDADRVELLTVPVSVDEIDRDSSAIFLPYTADESLDGNSAIPIDPEDSSTWMQPSPYREIMATESGRHEYYDKLYLGYWTGGIDWRNQIPVTSNVHVFSDFSVWSTGHKSMRLNVDLERGVESFLSVDERKLYKFTFVSDSLPEPRAVFYIRGRRYICRKLETSFSAVGMSRLIRGEFYRF